MNNFVISPLKLSSSPFKSSAIYLSHTHTASTLSLYLYIQSYTYRLIIAKMALQVQVNQVLLKSSVAPTPAQSASSPWRFNNQPVVCVAGDYGFSSRVLRNRGLSLKVKCSSSDATVTTTTVTVGQVTEVCKDTFWPIVEAAGEKTVVVDMYTQW